jgi:hypothetical protein
MITRTVIRVTGTAIRKTCTVMRIPCRARIRGNMRLKDRKNLCWEGETWDQENTAGYSPHIPPSPPSRKGYLSPSCITQICIYSTHTFYYSFSSFPHIYPFTLKIYFIFPLSSFFSSNFKAPPPPQMWADIPRGEWGGGEAQKQKRFLFIRILQKIGVNTLFQPK